MVRHARGLGLATQTNILLGFPDETRADMAESVANAIAMDFDVIYFCYVEPKENTRVWRDFHDRGITSAGAVLPLPTASCRREEVMAMRDQAIIRFERTRMAARIARESREDGPAILQSLDQLPAGSPLFVFGTGLGAALMAEAMRGMPGLCLAGFVDIERTEAFENLPVHHIDRFTRDFAPDTPVILSNRHVAENTRRLRAMGFHQIYDAHPMVMRMALYVGYPAPRPTLAAVFGAR